MGKLGARQNNARAAAVGVRKHTLWLGGRFPKTSVINDEPVSPAETLMRAAGSVPAERAEILSTPSKIFSAVGLRQRFWLQMNSIFLGCDIHRYFSFFTNTFELRPL